MAEKQYKLRDLPSLPRGKRLAFFWEYYRIHTLVLLVVLALTVWTIHDIVTNVEPDYTVAIIAQGVTQEESDALSTLLSQLDLDVNEDGQTAISVQLTQVIDGATDYYTNMKLVASFAAGEYDVLLLDTPSANALLEMGALAKPDGTAATTLEEADCRILPDALQPAGATLTACRCCIPNLTDEILVDQSTLLDALEQFPTAE